MHQKALQAGRFIVQSAGYRASGLAAHEVLQFLKDSKSNDVEIFLINRVSDDGRLELRGVREDSIREEDCLIVRFDDVRIARQVYESIREIGTTADPPCSMKLEFARVPAWDSAPVIAAIFPAPCLNSVAAWLKNALKDDLATHQFQCGAEVLSAYHSGAQILESEAIPTWDSQAG